MFYGERCKIMMKFIYYMMLKRKLYMFNFKIIEKCCSVRLSWYYIHKSPFYTRRK